MAAAADRRDRPAKSRGRDCKARARARPLQPRQATPGQRSGQRSVEEQPPAKPQPVCTNSQPSHQAARATEAVPLLRMRSP
eukprot:10652265-Alexandrium_andersonii.AAC.1